MYSPVPLVSDPPTQLIAVLLRHGLALSHVLVSRMRGLEEDAPSNAKVLCCTEDAGKQVSWDEKQAAPLSLVIVARWFESDRARYNTYTQTNEKLASLMYSTVLTV